MKRVWVRGTKIVVYLAVVLTILTVAVAVVTKPPAWSLDWAVDQLPTVPRNVIAAYRECDAAHDQIPAGCEGPIAVTENQEVDIFFESLKSLRGLWQGSLEAFTWEGGSLPATSHSDFWGEAMAGYDLEPKTVNPYITVVILDVGEDELHRSIGATAKLTVSYPEEAGSGIFDTASVGRQRQLNLFVISKVEMRELQRYTRNPSQREGVLGNFVLRFLGALDFLVGITIIVILLIAFRRAK